MKNSAKQSGAMTLPATLSNLRVLKDFITSQLSLFGFSTIQCQQIELVCDELLTNIIHYSYPECVGDVTVHCKQKDCDSMEIRIVDQGVPYNPLSAPDPDITLGVDEREIGGLGIFLVRQIADQVSYTRHSDSNILSLTFIASP